MQFYFFFFLVSGFCSILYEVIWLRLAMAQYGVTTPLVSLVLSIFMLGLGLGSWGAPHSGQSLGTTAVFRASLCFDRIVDRHFGAGGPTRVDLGKANLGEAGAGRTLELRLLSDDGHLDFAFTCALVCLYGGNVSIRDVRDQSGSRRRGTAIVQLPISCECVWGRGGSMASTTSD